MAAGESRFAGRATVGFAAFFKKAGAGGVVDGTVNSAASKEFCIGSVDDCIDVQRGDVTFLDLDSVSHGKIRVDSCAWMDDVVRFQRTNFFLANHDIENQRTRGS